MDESWKRGMGATTKPTLPRRRSTEETTARSGDADDFSDVYGGPPRTVISRQFAAGEFNRSSNPFYEEIFRTPETAEKSRIGRNLPEFRIPSSGERSKGFYSDIFGTEDGDRRSRSRSKSNSKSKSKSNSSSVLSSEDLSPLRPAVCSDDGSFSSFASKLRPINIPCRWNSSTMVPKEHTRQQDLPAFPYNQSSNFDSLFPESDFIDNFKSSHFGFSRRVPSPETISLDPNSYRSIKIPMDDLELNSPSSVVSSLCQDSEAKASKIRDEVLQGQEMEQEEDEVMSSYTIEINADHREGTEETLGIDEAIAWAKRKFYKQSSDKFWSKHGKDQSNEAEGFSNEQMDGNGPMQSPVVNFVKAKNYCYVFDNKINISKYMNQFYEKEQIEMDLLDEEIRSWSAGKEANIRMLLSTLHHILWPDSGCYVIPLTNLVDSSQVKKAYQKARLCLHPDKLQQRGATIKQKYVADKAFSILQVFFDACNSLNLCYL
ncbi:chaperone DnaJ-domain superfamily protein [Actinidia rufa]|uniref:Chaperone DnaJ-domain superfamily protein n=1 Tax=Actinidia rufa TaxID=165716 RepID=A0A7J0EQR2_9ERIC|nr:chaperone DnaJ-domain superfamily protein [Actinidia rufa]